MAYVDFDMSQLKSFFERIEKAAKGDLKKEMELFLEGLGFEFLRILEDEIIRRQVLDTRLLLASFEKGNANNVWELNEGGLTLEVGTNLEYAGYVNDGHWTNSKGVERRFVPGRWEGDKFIYDPSSKQGMVLKQKWIEGSHYWESALRILERIYPEILEKKLQEWLDSYFSA
ncbi:MAG: HK97 gp10 family phage protein [Oscillospiraceae bacterium]